MLGNEISIKALMIQYSPAHDMFVLDMSITNKSNLKFNLSKLKLIANRKNLSLSRQILVKDSDSIDSKKSGHLRLFFKPERQDDVTISVQMNNEHASFNIAKVYLK